MHSERHSKAILIERVTTAARRMREPPNEGGNQHALRMRERGTSAISIQ
jgi:hypothetical protein